MKYRMIDIYTGKPIIKKKKDKADILTDEEFIEKLKHSLSQGDISPLVERDVR